MISFKGHRWLILAALLLAPAAGWSQAVSYTVSPMTAEVVVKAGTTQNGVITVKHEVPTELKGSTQPLHLRVYALDWTLDRSGTPQFAKPGTNDSCCTNWLQINPVELVIPAGEQRDVRVTIKVPKEAQGTYHTVIMFETIKLPEYPGQKLVGLNGRIGSTIYLQVGSQVKRARVTQFVASSQKVQMTVENTGTSQIRLKGVLQYRDASDKLIQEVPLPAAVVLPGKDNLRDLAVDAPKLPSGAYTVSALLDYGGDVLLGARAHVTTP
ncbi:MAG TPA: hypothetical protein VFA07_19100 [Chthonomonadaceae bacterium]|nr:hypothetical protein [Chthonomonadaceae bacterium]